jgi:hypothetical protein
MKKTRMNQLVAVAFCAAVACAEATTINLVSRDIGSESDTLYSDTTLMRIGSRWATYAGNPTTDYELSGGVDEGLTNAWNTDFSVTLGGISVVNTNVGSNLGAALTPGGIDRDGSGRLGVRGQASNGIDPYEGLSFGVDASNLDSSLAFRISHVYLQYVNNGETGMAVNRNDTSKSMTFGAVGTGSDFETNVGVWWDISSLDLLIPGGTSDSEVLSLFHTGGATSAFRIDGFKLHVETIPEPATLGLFGLVAAFALVVRRFRI